jgi:hypothetical protein
MIFNVRVFLLSAKCIWLKFSLTELKDTSLSLLQGSNRTRSFGRLDVAVAYDE